jgi:hypothetical protein
LQLPPQLINRLDSRQGKKTCTVEELLTARSKPSVELAFHLSDSTLKQITGPLSDQSARAGNGGGQWHMPIQ